MTEKQIKDLLMELYRLGAGTATLNVKLERATEIQDKIVAAFRRPMVGVGVIVLNAVDRKSALNLLIEQRKGERGGGEWSVPGGWVEYGETFEQAALRELREETGLVAEDARFLTAVMNTYSFGLHCCTGFVVVRGWRPDPDNAAAVRVNGPVITEPDKMANLGFCPLSDLPEPLFPPLKSLFDRAKDINFTLDEVCGRKKT